MVYAPLSEGAFTHMTQGSRKGPIRKQKIFEKIYRKGRKNGLWPVAKSSRRRLNALVI